MIDVLLTTVTLVAAKPPTLTVAPAAKSVPVIVTGVPPAVEPVPGATPPTVGAGLETDLNVAICMTQGPAELSDAVAL